MLENCPHITSVNFSECDGYFKDEYGDRKEKVSEGIYGMLLCECSFVFGAPVRFLGRNFFSENLSGTLLSAGSTSKDSRIFPFPFDLSLTYTFLPTCQSCPPLHLGDKEALKKALPKCSFYFWRSNRFNFYGFPVFVAGSTLRVYVLLSKQQQLQIWSPRVEAPTSTLEKANGSAESLR